MNHLKVLSLLVIAVFATCFIRPVAAQSATFFLPIGQPVEQFVDINQTSRAYQFSALEDRSIFLLAVSRNYQNAPNVILSDRATAENIASVKAAVSGVCLRIAPGMDSYTLNVNANLAQASQQRYGLLLVSGDPTQMMCSDDMMTSFGSFFSDADLNDANSADFNGGFLRLGSDFEGMGSTCQASSGVNGSANVRGTNDPNSPIVGQIGTGEVFPVLGTNADNSSLLIDLNGTPGFASSRVLTISGDCSQSSVVAVDGNDVSPTDSLVDLSDIVRTDSNIGGPDTDALDLNNGDDGLDLDAVATGDNQPGINVTGDNGNGGLNVDADGNTGDQTGADASVTDDGDSIVDVDGDTSGVDVNETGTNAACFNVLGIEITCP